MKPEWVTGITVNNGDPGTFSSYAFSSLSVQMCGNGTPMSARIYTRALGVEKMVICVSPHAWKSNIQNFEKLLTTEDNSPFMTGA